MIELKAIKSGVNYVPSTVKLTPLRHILSCRATSQKHMVFPSVYKQTEADRSKHICQSPCQS